jgi:DNA repair exonuclease SbcCD ATPase subunit
MVIASVENGRVQSNEKQYQPGIDNLLLDSSNGVEWLEWVNSFRYEPTGTSKPYTARKEASGYWYGYRKISGRLHKKYIGKSSEVNTAKLEEIAEALNIPPQPRVTGVTDKVVNKVTNDRLTALELQVQALQESLEALREELRGKLKSGDSAELPKVDSEVAEGLQNDLGNLKTENETLRQELADARADYSKLLESSTVVTNKLREEVQEVRSQLETEKTRGEEIGEELSDTEQALAEVRSENSELKKSCAELRSQLETERADREQIEAQLTDLKQKSATAGKDLPEAADLLNQLKTKRKKSTTTLADIEKILEILEGTA